MEKFKNVSLTELLTISGGKKKSLLHEIGDAIGSYYKGYYKGLFG